MQPRPTAETAGPPLPSSRYSIAQAPSATASVLPTSRLSFPALARSSQIPGGCPGGGVIPVIPDFFPPPRLRPDSSSSRASFSFFLNAFRAFFISSSVAMGTSSIADEWQSAGTQPAHVDLQEQIHTD